MSDIKQECFSCEWPPSFEQLDRLDQTTAVDYRQVIGLSSMILKSKTTFYVYFVLSSHVI